jgi:uncharacterized membrane protein YfcA
MSGFEFLIFAFIVMLGNLTETIAGFGSTILSLTLGAHLFPMESLIPVLVPLNVGLSLVILIRDFKSIDWSELRRRIVPATGAGFPLGLWISTHAPGSLLQSLFGGVVLALSLFEILKSFRGTASHPLHPWVARCFLFAGGIMQGLYASGGPFVVYHTARAIHEKRRFRATLSFLWFVLNSILFLSLIGRGSATPDTLKQTLFLVPAVLAALALGEWIHHRIPERAFRLGVYVLLVVAGGSLILRS